MSNLKHIETDLIHAGIDGDSFTGSVNVPIYQTSTYQQDGIGKTRNGWEYSRTGNPTRFALEKLIADLEHGSDGFAFASGMAAVTAVLQLFNSGDKILITNNVYGGTYRVLDRIFSRFNLSFESVDTSNPDHVRQKITPDVKAIWIESPANPLLTITDLKLISSIAYENQLLTIVDNTFMTPYLQNPLDLGADIVVHSATKYLGGHSDLIAGLVVTKDSALGKELAFIQNATGGVLQPFDSFLLIRGIKTLALRMDRHVENTVKIARHLDNHPAIKKIYYPGLPYLPGYEINRRQAKNGGAMISFELKKEYNVEQFFKSLQIIRLAESLGGVESLVCHPATMTHASIPEDLRNQLGIIQNLIRLSPGIENIKDLIADLNQAITRSKV